MYKSWKTVMLRTGDVECGQSLVLHSLFLIVLTLVYRNFIRRSQVIEWYQNVRIVKLLYRKPALISRWVLFVNQWSLTNRDCECSNRSWSPVLFQLSELLNMQNSGERQDTSIPMPVTIRHLNMHCLSVCFFHPNEKCRRQRKYRIVTRAGRCSLKLGD